MNPFKLAKANLVRNLLANGLFMILIGFSVALAIGLSTQERALKNGSARAADKFDLVIGAPGGRMDLLFASVFLRPASVNLINGDNIIKLQAADGVEFAAPLAFGDSVDDLPIVGTIREFIAHLTDNQIAGRYFQDHDEAVVGAGSGLKIGDDITPAHGIGVTADADAHKHTKYKVVGIMPPTGTPWDRAVVVPVEAVWEAHQLPNGHAPENHEALGQPFEPNFTPPIPAIIVKPSSFAKAYGLRQQFRTDQTMAFFPAESLVELYQYLGNAASVMNLFAFITQILVIIAILSGVVALLRIQRKQTAIIQALGASGLYTTLYLWLYTLVIIGGGVGLGIILGWGSAFLISELFTRETGIVLSTTITLNELKLALAIFGVSMIIALITVLLLRIKPISQTLKDS